MEKKSLGSFIALLRKEKGLTQKQLAELLNVSDKTVSHWECDKYSPDISAIPVLADFFGVTCDEILRGERKANEENKYISNETEEPAESERDEKAEDIDNDSSYNDNVSPIKEDEYAEITPNHIRIRKIILDETERKRANKN